MSKTSVAIRDKKIKDTIFTFLDVETTGICPQYGDRICEIALLQWKNDQVIDKFHSLVNPGRPISFQASAVNGLTDEMVCEAPFFHELVEGILTFIGDTVIVGHNVSFDIGFLRAHLLSLQLKVIENTTIDTLALARRYYQFSSNSLGNIARALRIPVVNAHRAMGDVETTKEIFSYFLKDLKIERIQDIKPIFELR